MKDLKETLDQLFIECEHGDAEHRLWLKNKFDDFLKRRTSGVVIRQTSIGPKTDIYQDGVLIGSSG